MIAYLAGVCEKKRGAVYCAVYWDAQWPIGKWEGPIQEVLCEQNWGGGCMFDRSCKRDPGVKRKSYLRTCIFRHDRAIRTYHNSGLGTTLAK
jgi:hypothetical protein